MLSDMTARFLEVEKNHYTQINNLNAQMQAVNSNYEIMKEKPHLLLQNTIISILTIPLFLAVCYIIYILSPNFFVDLSAKISNMPIVLTVITFLLPILVVIINVIRAKIKYSNKKNKADYWWEHMGKSKIVELNNSINCVKSEAYNYLNKNPLYGNLRDFGWDNSNDCYELYKIAAFNQLDSLVDAIAIYNERLEIEYQREEARQRHQEILDALEEANRESVLLREELEEQGRRADFDRGILEMQLNEIRYRR